MEDLQVFFNYLVQERSLSPASCRVYLHGIRFLYLKVLHWAHFDVTLVLPKRPQRIPELLTRQEVARLLASVLNPKHQALLSVTYGCGLRVSEAVSLKVKDIDGERHLLRIEQGKGAKDRMVPLAPGVLQALRRYWQIRHPMIWLFPSDLLPDRHLHITTPQKVYHTAKTTSGIEKCVGIHALRHASAGAGVAHSRAATALGLQRFAQHSTVSALVARRYTPKRGSRRPDRKSRRCVIAGTLSVQSILARFLPGQTLDSHRRKVCARLTDCRTARMGGMEMRCDHCQAHSVCYYGCRDRHCPQCQGHATEQWSARQRSLLLPVPYFHLVFTLPHTLNGWVQIHPDVVYRCLFAAVWNTLNQFGRNTRHLGGELGMTAVLHTWGQNLSRHVHVHCLIPGGVLTGTGDWHKAKNQYLFPVRALSRRFRGRMVSMDGDLISFRYKDHRNGSRIKTQWLEEQEFVWRFLMHILPKGFMRIRHFGYLSNCTRRRKLAVIRHCLSQPPKSEATLENPASQRCWPCLLCNNGLVRMVRQIPRFKPAVIPTG